MGFDISQECGYLINMSGDSSLKIAKSFGYMQDCTCLNHTKIYLTSEVDKSSLPKAIIMHVAKQEPTKGFEEVLYPALDNTVVLGSVKSKYPENASKLDLEHQKYKEALRKVVKKAEGKAAKEMMEELKTFGVIESGLKSVYTSDFKLYNLEVSMEYGSEIMKDGDLLDDIEIACDKKGCHVVNTDEYDFSGSIPFSKYLTHLIT